MQKKGLQAGFDLGTQRGLEDFLDQVVPETEKILSGTSA